MPGKKASIIGSRRWVLCMHVAVFHSLKAPVAQDELRYRELEIEVSVRNSSSTMNSSLLIEADFLFRRFRDTLAISGIR